MVLAKKKADDLGFDVEAIDLPKCEKTLLRTVPTDPETNQLIAREALNEFMEGEDWKEKTVFISLQKGHKAQKLLLEPAFEYCPICW